MNVFLVFLDNELLLENGFLSAEEAEDAITQHQEENLELGFLREQYRVGDVVVSVPLSTRVELLKEAISEEQKTRYMKLLLEMGIIVKCGNCRHENLMDKIFCDQCQMVVETE